MQHTMSAPVRVAETVGIFALTLAAVAALGAVLAYWTWAWIAPRPTAPGPAAAHTPTLESAYRLFGGARTAAAPTQTSFSLIGVAASSGAGRGYAIVNNGTRTLVVRAGDEAAPDVRLAEVHPTHVVLDYGGRRETLDLPKRKK